MSGLCSSCGQNAPMPGHDLCHGCDEDGIREEPTDNEIYNRPGVEGGIGYPLGEPAYDEHDWRL